MDQNNPQNISPKELFDLLQDNVDQPFLIDVREEMELHLAPFPSPVLSLPLSKASIWSESLKTLLPSEQMIVVICHAGVRSFNFGKWLLAQQVNDNIRNLEGGIDAWSLQIDSSVPRY